MLKRLFSTALTKCPYGCMKAGLAAQLPRKRCTFRMEGEIIKARLTSGARKGPVSGAREG